MNKHINLLIVKMEKVLTERRMVVEYVLSMKAMTNNGREFNEICSYFIYHLKCGFFGHNFFRNRIRPHMWLIIDE